MPTARSTSSSADVATAPSMWPALALSLAAFLTNFDVTAVVVALPTIADELGLGIAGQAWMMDGYSLAFTAALLVAGALADSLGRRRAMLGGNLVFAAASVVCALSADGLTLGLARVLQGLGAAFVMTGGIALIAALYPQAASRTRVLGGSASSRALRWRSDRASAAAFPRGSVGVGSSPPICRRACWRPGAFPGSFPKCAVRRGVRSIISGWVFLARRSAC
ncbi:MFS transporter [Bradyrhizobium oligotrophicum]|uniref:MFS transporter n=1 Tax=Bradyrhizobium oligotrophicum TaxID=44255 RepID=UPI003EBFBEEB